MFHPTGYVWAFSVPAIVIFTGKQNNFIGSKHTYQVFLGTLRVFFCFRKEVKQRKMQNFSEWSRFGAIGLSSDLIHSSVLGVKS